MTNEKEILDIIALLKMASQFISDTRTKLCSPFGLSHIQAVLIMDIHHNRDATKITDICKRLKKSTNTISPLINRMIAKGFMFKQQNLIDNRVYEVFLTSEGEDTIEKINQSVTTFAKPLFNSLTDEERFSLKNSLEALRRVCIIE